MTKHIKSCMQNSRYSENILIGNKSYSSKIFHIVVEGRYCPEYWLHVKVSGNAKLDDLDRFFRDIWLECCGHLSSFDIQELKYSSSPMEEYDEKGMNIKLGNLLGSKTKFLYEYDFGSTTELALKVVSVVEAKGKGKAVELLARNNPPLFVCGSCNDKATQVCGECACSDDGWVCDKCASNHGCGDEMLFPVVNSPRMGVCGYTG